MNCCSRNILAPVQSLLCTIYTPPNQFSRVDGWLAKCLVPGLPPKSTPVLAGPVSVAQNIELSTHTLSGITISFYIPDKEPKYRSVRLNTGHLAAYTVHAILNNVCPACKQYDRPRRLECAD